jgi:septal ring factor EnvC (AmiA/AmiB activator)
VAAAEARSTAASCRQSAGRHDQEAADLTRQIGQAETTRTERADRLRRGAEQIGALSRDIATTRQLRTATGAPERHRLDVVAELLRPGHTQAAGGGSSPERRRLFKQLGQREATGEIAGRPGWSRY